MRGKALPFLLCPVSRGITPAYAGKSLFFIGSFPDVRDHPRVCGEKKRASRKRCGRMGSPPRMRGKASFFGIFCPGVRITPAYAGKSRCRHPHPTGKGDHPRVCGEKHGCAHTPHNAAGSPPRMRGKEHRTRQAVYKDRITPAYAGKRRSPLSGSSSARDHPRVCGEKLLSFTGCCRGEGSPPRMRGKET